MAMMHSVDLIVTIPYCEPKIVGQILYLLMQTNNIINICNKQCHIVSLNRGDAEAWGRWVQHWQRLCRQLQPRLLSGTAPAY